MCLQVGLITHTSKGSYLNRVVSITCGLPVASYIPSICIHQAVPPVAVHQRQLEKTKRPTSTHQLRSGAPPPSSCVALGRSDPPSDAVGGTSHGAPATRDRAGGRAGDRADRCWLWTGEMQGVLDGICCKRDVSCVRFSSLKICRFTMGLEILMQLISKSYEAHTALGKQAPKR